MSANPENEFKETLYSMCSTLEYWPRKAYGTLAIYMESDDREVMLSAHIRLYRLKKNSPTSFLVDDSLFYTSGFKDGSFIT